MNITIIKIINLFSLLFTIDFVYHIILYLLKIVSSKASKSWTTAYSIFVEIEMVLKHNMGNGLRAGDDVVGSMAHEWVTQQLPAADRFDENV